MGSHEAEKTENDVLGNPAVVFKFNDGVRLEVDKATDGDISFWAFIPGDYGRDVVVGGFLRMSEDGQHIDLKVDPRDTRPASVMLARLSVAADHQIADFFRGANHEQSV